MKAVVTAIILWGLSIPSVQAQDCQTGINHLQAALADTSTQSPEQEGASRQSGEAAEEHPQYGNPTPDDQLEATGASRQSGEAAGEHPQHGNPMPDDPAQAAGASRQPGEVAEVDPQFGNPMEAAGSSAMGAPSSSRSAEDRPQLNEAERRRISQLRDDAVAHAAAGRDEECLDALAEAEALLR